MDMKTSTKLRDIEFGSKFILERNGMKYKRISQENGHRSFVKPVNHQQGLLYKGKFTLSNQCNVIEVSD